MTDPEFYEGTQYNAPTASSSFSPGSLLVMAVSSVFSRIRGFFNQPASEAVSKSSEYTAQIRIVGNGGQFTDDDGLRCVRLYVVRYNPVRNPLVLELQDLSDRRKTLCFKPTQSTEFKANEPILIRKVGETYTQVSEIVSVPENVVPFRQPASIPERSA